VCVLYLCSESRQSVLHVVASFPAMIRFSLVFPTSLYSNMSYFLLTTHILWNPCVLSWWDIVSTSIWITCLIFLEFSNWIQNFRNKFLFEIPFLSCSSSTFLSILPYSLHIPIRHIFNNFAFPIFSIFVVLLHSLAFAFSQSFLFSFILCTCPHPHFILTLLSCKLCFLLQDMLSL